MASNMNPFQLIQLIQNNANPPQFIMRMLEEQAGTNPLFANLLQLARANNGKGIEQVARNVFKEKGRDFDKEFKDFKNNFGL